MKLLLIEKVLAVIILSYVFVVINDSIKSSKEQQIEFDKAMQSDPSEENAFIVNNVFWADPSSDFYKNATESKQEEVEPLKENETLTFEGTPTSDYTFSIGDGNSTMDIVIEDYKMSTLVFGCGNGEIQIDTKTGQVTLKDCDIPDAARAFWEAVEGLHPQYKENLKGLDQTGTGTVIWDKESTTSEQK
jgi:hypothetical protein